MSLSKIIPGERAAAELWKASGPSRSGQGQQSLVTANHLEELQQQAYKEGFEAGRSDGLAAGQAEIQQAVSNLLAIAEALQKPLAAVDETVEQELVALAFAIAKQMVRRELKTDQGQVVAVVREALAALPVASRTVRIHLHPDDSALVRDALAIADNRPAWEIVEDPVVTRGGCRVNTETARIEATVEKRLAAIAAKLLGGEREGDGPDDEAQI